MLGAIYIGLGGMNAYTQGLQTISNNVANLNTAIASVGGSNCGRTSTSSELPSDNRLKLVSHIDSHPKLRR